MVKVFNHEEKNMEEFRRRNEELRKASTSALTHGGRMVPVVVSISYLNYAVSACIGGLFAISGLMDLGSLSSYLVYVRQTAMPINQFTQQMNFIMATISGAERIFEVMEESEELDRGEITLAQVRTQPDGSLTEYRISSDERVPVSDKDNILQDREDEQWAWKCPQPDGSFVLRPMHGDVRFHDEMCIRDRSERGRAIFRDCGRGDRGISGGYFRGSRLYGFEMGSGGPV